MMKDKVKRRSIVLIRGEICVIVASLKRTIRNWNSNQQESESEVIVREFMSLKESLDSSPPSLTMSRLSQDPSYFLLPFIHLIRSENTSAPLTTLALSSLLNFIASGLFTTSTNTLTNNPTTNTSSNIPTSNTSSNIPTISTLSNNPASNTHVNNNTTSTQSNNSSDNPTTNTPTTNSASSAAEAIAHAVIHAHFISTDPVSDEIVLLKILHVLHKLYLSPLGVLLSNDSVCEMMQACLRMCIIERANELLRKSAEDSLTDMLRSLFTRLPTFSLADSHKTGTESRKKQSSLNPVITLQTPTPPPLDKKPQSQLEGGDEGDEAVSLGQTGETSPVVEKEEKREKEEGGEGERTPTPDFQNNSGVKFINNEPALDEEVIDNGSNNKRVLKSPHDVVGAREMMRLLISLLSSAHEKRDKSEIPLQLGLKLILVALESGGEGIEKHSSILALVKNELCKNLFSLLSLPPQHLSPTVLLHVCRIFSLIFENFRPHLKYQLELFINKITEIINETQSGVGNNVPKWTFEQREIALDFLVQLWKLPCFPSELYLNYDCDLFCSNLFEETTKLLSKNSFPLQMSLNSTHLLCLDGLLSILDGIETHCTLRLSANNGSGSSSDDSNTSVFYHGAEERRVTIGGGQGRGSGGSEEMGLPTHEELMGIRHKKKIFHSGSEQFNGSPSKGVEFLQAHGVLSSPLDPSQVAGFLRENPLLDKKCIGDWISNRKNSSILSAFVSSFNFNGLRVDEALRLFLESFRLPGEAGPIALILEEFASHWSKSNGNPFATVDAAYILAYQVIMLNVDQHNSNVKKNGQSMTVEGLRANLKGCNGGADFDPIMLKEIYNAIKSDEIIMPAEQVGPVKDNYLWKVLLRRSESPTNNYLSPVGGDEGAYDHSLFSLSWGPIVSSLSFIFDRSSDTNIIGKTIGGFRKTATIAAHYSMADVFDNLVISLTKFTTLISSSPELGVSMKSGVACRQMFQLVHRHGDILREGWKNFVDCLVSLFKLELLPKILSEVEDFEEPTGRVSLLRRSQLSAPRQEGGIFSSLYSYIALSTDSPGSKGSVAEEEENKKKAKDLIAECRPELLLSESKFLQLDSLLDLIKALISASPLPEPPSISNKGSNNSPANSNIDVGESSVSSEDEWAFVMELLVKIGIQNRDRALSFYPLLHTHLTAPLSTVPHPPPYIIHRATLGLLRIGLRLMRREELVSTVLHSLSPLLLVKYDELGGVGYQVCVGLHEIVRTSAANIHSHSEWALVFKLLEYVGAGKPPIAPPQHYTHHSDGERVPISSSPIGHSSASDRGYTSDSELEIKTNDNFKNLSPSQSWILLSQEETNSALTSSPRRPVPSINLNVVDRGVSLNGKSNPKSLLKSTETLSFLIRDGAHITPHNFTLCLSTIRTFVEASLHRYKAPVSTNNSSTNKKKRTKKGNDGLSKSRSFPNGVSQLANYDADESESEEQGAATQQVALQLLDLISSLLTRVPRLMTWWLSDPPPSLPLSLSPSSDKSPSWSLGFQPLLTSLSLLSTDSRRIVRTAALAHLQRSLLLSGLQELGPRDWLACFREVLFPLLERLLGGVNPGDGAGVEETRIRATTLLSKVFLQHLSPLLELDEFSELWLSILSLLHSYMTPSPKSELLSEAIPETLKNMLLVMETAGIFHTPDGYTKLWASTWETIDTFLPSLRTELLRAVPPTSHQVPSSAPVQPPTNLGPPPELPQNEFIEKNASAVRAGVENRSSGETPSTASGPTPNNLGPPPEVAQNEHNETNASLSKVGPKSRSLEETPSTGSFPTLIKDGTSAEKSESEHVEKNVSLLRAGADVSELVPIVLVDNSIPLKNVLLSSSPSRAEYTSIIFGDEDEGEMSQNN